MTKKQKKNLKRIVIALIMFFVVMLTNLILKHIKSLNLVNGLADIIPNKKFGWLLPFGLYFMIYLYIGHDVLKKSAINISHGQVFDENFLMSVATLGAFGLGIYTGVTTGEPEGFDEACAVLLFYQLGEWFQSYAAGKARKNISSLMDIRPDFARIIEDDNEILKSPEEIKVGDIIVVKPGEKIPLDGIIIFGSSTLDTKALTGESLPRDVREFDEVISGTINLTSLIKVKVSKEYTESTVSKILNLVENASSEKSKSEAFITKFAKYYTPIVVISALLLAFIPPIINLIMGNNPMFNDWIYRALSFLVVSCPCALVISVPLSFFSGLGGASRNGVLIKGSIHLERFDKANIFVFDKTGTLTKGNFKVCEVYGKDKNSVIKYAKIAEKDSSHPIALSIKELEYDDLEEVEEYVLENVAGFGVIAHSDKDTIVCGNEKLMNKENIEYVKSTSLGTVVYVALNGEFLGYIVIEDEIKEDTIETIDYLNSVNAKTIMLTGDNEKVASKVAQNIHISDYKANLLPQNKVEEVDKLLNKKKDNEYLCFVGDGINDAPVIMKSDIGIAMGGVGSDAAIEASDIVLMHDDLKSIITAKKVARKTMRIVYENILFALTIKVLILVFAALGFANMWISVFGDVGVAVLAILNAMRANSKKY